MSVLRLTIALLITVSTTCLVDAVEATADTQLTANSPHMCC
ncbi:MAG TPA: hypothetical protein VFA96_01055 [Nocardioides sp.]|nr:hypothetical protein [Nocardioides sp.]